MTARIALTVLAAFAGLALSACDTSVADPEVEPTGRSCDIQSEPEALCSDGESVAFCGNIAGEVEYGPCIPPEEIECQPGEKVKMYEDELCGTMYRRCELTGGEPGWIEDTCDTPLVLSFDGGPIEMIDAEATPAATFDISMSFDSCITTDWPSATTPWLVADLDGNGSIDGGHELFGSGTRLQDGERARHGFAALAEFDQNGDGVVDGADPRFGQLMLWRDVDADRLSSSSELVPLADEGVTSLPVEFEVDIQCDDRGNCGAQRAAFEHAGGAGEIVDLYLACH